MSLMSCQRRVNEAIPDSITVGGSREAPSESYTELPALTILSRPLSTCNGQAMSFLTAAPLHDTMNIEVCTRTAILLIWLRSFH